MRNVIIMSLSMVLLMVLTGLVSSASSGKEVFIGKCGQCHGENKEAKKFAPTKYASAQWERFFKRNKHKRKKDISSRFSEAEMQMVKKYLIKHAADSDQPEAIGLR